MRAPSAHCLIVNISHGQYKRTVNELAKGKHLSIVWFHRMSRPATRDLYEMHEWIFKACTWMHSHTPHTHTDNKRTDRLNECTIVLSSSVSMATPPPPPVGRLRALPHSAHVRLHFWIAALCYVFVLVCATDQSPNAKPQCTTYALHCDVKLLNGTSACSADNHILLFSPSITFLLHLFIRFFIIHMLLCAALLQCTIGAAYIQQAIVCLSSLADLAKP